MGLSGTRLWNLFIKQLMGHPIKSKIRYWATYMIGENNQQIDFVKMKNLFIKDPKSYVETMVLMKKLLPMEYNSFCKFISEGSTVIFCGEKNE